MASNKYCVIMAGGIGSRFWPKSRQSMPKQFLDILGTGKSFIRHTYERFAKIVPAENFLVVTNHKYKDLVLEHIPEIGERQVLCEPIGRNTAPCIAYAAYTLMKQNPDAEMIVTPADHLILNEEDFRQIIGECLEFADKHDALLTVGIKPTRPDTGYGYIQVSDTNVISKVKCFTEKPNLELAIPILAISGSNGKTTTKELVSRVLAERFEVYATHGNLNNHIGVPLTLLAMTRDTEFGVVEMGASACGELALLASVAEPNYGILTNIGLAHLEGFGGPEGVRRGKGELFDFLAANGGHAFVPADDEILTGMAAERDSLAAEYYSASLADGIENHLEGSYNRFNIAAAVAVGHYFDVPDERIRHAIASYVPDNNRSQRIGTSRNTLVADCYNANPSSMRASVGNFLAEPLEERQRRVLILGDMLELGDWSEREHAAIIEMAAQDPEAELLLVGPEFAKAYDGLAEKPANVTLCPTRDDLISLLKVSPVEHSLVLVKGSHGMGLEQALEAL